MTASAGKLAMLGKYLMLERVAVGGMAEVWLAKRVEPEKKISKLLAIKRIQPQLSADPEFVKMFIDEARIAGLLQHPSIAPMYELGRVGDTYYIAMEFVWGRDLLQLLRTLKAAKQAMPFVGAAHVAARLCDALHYAHVKVDKNGTPLDLVHRDVSPQNVLLGFDGQVKLIDFGIAKASSRTTKTKAGMLKGKVGYMSPEQVRGLPVDARSDVFAVGTLLYEMIAVRPLFARGNNLEAMNRVREADVPPLESRVPDVPPALARIVERALQREAAERFASADEMKQALLAFLATQPDRFESEELASWLQALFSDEHWREKEKLDALDQIARPVATPVATAPVPERTSGTELASRSLFDDTEDEESTQVADLAPYARASAAPEPVADRLSSEVFFHRDEFVQVGEANPEGPAARPLKALFRPGRASAVEAYRAPIVGREDSPASARASVPPGAARTSVRPSVPSPREPVRPSRDGGPIPGRVGPPDRGGPVRPPRREDDETSRVSVGPEPARTSSVLQRSSVPAPSSPSASGRSPGPSSGEITWVDEDPPTRATEPHHAPSHRPPERTSSPGRGSSPGTTRSFEDPVSNVMKAPRLLRRVTDDDDETFDDGGIREPLVPPIESSARIVAVSDQPPEEVRPSRPRAGGVPRDRAPTAPGTDRIADVLATQVEEESTARASLVPGLAGGSSKPGREPAARTAPSRTREPEIAPREPATRIAPSIASEPEIAAREPATRIAPSIASDSEVAAREPATRIAPSIASEPEVPTRVALPPEVATTVSPVQAAVIAAPSRIVGRESMHTPSAPSTTSSTSSMGESAPSPPTEGAAPIAASPITLALEEMAREPSQPHGAVPESAPAVAVVAAPPALAARGPLRARMTRGDWAFVVMALLLSLGLAGVLALSLWQLGHLAAPSWGSWGGSAPSPQSAQRFALEEAPRSRSQGTVA